MKKTQSGITRFTSTGPERATMWSFQIFFEIIYKLWTCLISSSGIPPSCIDRLVAAVTAEIAAARNPAFSSASTPAIVVPPGLVTSSLSFPGCCLLSLFKTISAAPFTVCAASSIATSLGNPERTPPSASASMNKYTYAGPLPLKPVTAFNKTSLSFLATPTAPRSFATISSSFSLQRLPIAYPEAASPTRQGVFGITRTMRLPGRNFSNVAKVIPAAMLMINASLSTFPMSAQTSSTTFGLTAITITSFAFLQTSSLDAVPE
mmetsp:Transcript_16155/g.44736  ORF Transcript_16155/g.44736 Transcript_16155/m.44736 type:complete len:263 (-) Transcript_16155:290-1078(-)